MKPITWDTTFQEIGDLVKSKDPDFITICKILYDKKNKGKVYQGYKIEHFSFLMGIVLRETDDKDFLDISCISHKKWFYGFCNYLNGKRSLSIVVINFLHKLDKSNKLNLNYSP